MNPIKRLLFALLVVAGSLTLAQKFSFVAIGDMPYGAVPQFDNLIKAINAFKPSFSVHVGDIKTGSSPCTDEYINSIRTMFESFEQPLIYTPGDNEWTDCHREAAGKLDPIERLAFVRKTFFPNAQSLGKQKMTLEVQSADARFAKFVENRRWSMNGIQFATLHIIGSNNNLQRDQAAVNEYIERNAANLAWLESTFTQATAQNAKAIVLCLQANMYFEDPNEERRSGFTDFLASLKAKARAFAKPVLVIHGDSHALIIDFPWNTDLDQTVPNLMRLEVFGNARIHGVEVMVDPDSVGVFGFRPLMVRENLQAPK